MQSPYLADDIDGLYVNYASRNGSPEWATPRPMRMITLRGVPNGRRPEMGPVDMLNAIDPETGKTQFSTNLPIYRFEAP
jgi:hypothetical protein